MKRFWKEGEPLVWATGAALTVTLLMMLILVAVCLWNGMGVFWPHAVTLITLEDGTRAMGEQKQETINPDTDVTSIQLKTGNRDVGGTGQDFEWFEKQKIAERTYPADAVVLERQEDGNFYGFLESLELPTLQVPAEGSLYERLHGAMDVYRQRYEEEVGSILAQTADLSARLQRVQWEIMSLEYEKKQALRRSASERRIRELEERIAEEEKEATQIKAESDRLVREQEERVRALRRNKAVFRTARGTEAPIVIGDIVRAFRPNTMGFFAKVGHYIAKIGELLFDEPRESNTEGGLFPAIFGTVMLVFLMALSSFPLGVVAGVYMREYAKEGLMVRMVRIAVNNLAGIPSIVYGIFGLGFFVYGVGGMVDRAFFPYMVDAGQPVFGTGGILWASMTLGILTVPVVIVSTEEALGAIPMGVREGSLALGATKFQTLVRVLIPMASPGIMTGFILAMARAAGEVAPLMITGVVKLAPALPLDGTFPYFHLDRKFMHLGFHIYDIGFQSPNVEAAKPMVYVTTLLLLLIVIVMSSTAIGLRNYMRKKYQIRSI